MRAAQFDPHPTIYFVRSEYQGLIKIGYSTAVVSRMRNLQLDSSAPLRLLGLREGTRADEAALFARFAAHRSHGEWYHPHDDLLAYIAAEMDPPPVYLRRILGDRADLLMATTPRLFGMDGHEDEGQRPSQGGRGNAVPKGYVALGALARLVGRSEYGLRDMVARGTLPSVKVCRRRLIKAEHAEALRVHIAAGGSLSTFLANAVDPDHNAA